MVALFLRFFCGHAALVAGRLCFFVAAMVLALGGEFAQEWADNNFGILLLMGSYKNRR